jgi:hypothetical protein
MGKLKRSVMRASFCDGFPGFRDLIAGGFQGLRTVDRGADEISCGIGCLLVGGPSKP